MTDGTRKRFALTPVRTCRIALMLGRFVLVILSVGLLLGGCGKEPIQVGGELPEKLYGRIVSLSPSTTEIIALLGLETKIVGRTAACDAPETIRDRPIVANPTPNVELIISLQPDIVIFDASLFSGDDPAIVKLEEAGLEIRPVDINSVDEWRDVVVDLGNLLSQQVAASKEIDKLTASLHKGKLDPQPSVLIAMGGSQPMVAGVDSFQGDVARKAGAVSVGPASNRFETVNIEQIASWNPDVVFVSDDPNVYLSNAGWAATNAGRNGRIFRVHPNLLLRPGARVADLIGSMHDTMRNEFSQSSN